MHQILARAARECPDTLAVRDETGSWDYRELDRFSRSAAAWLRERGVGRGDRVLCCLPNSRHLVGLMYGALRSGAVFVPVSPDARLYQLRSLVEDCGPAVIVTETGNPLAGDPREIDVARLCKRLPAAPETVDEANAEDVALFMYTSGSTSHPKAVVCRHRQVAFAVEAIAERLRYRSDDVVYCRLPFTFDYGLYQTFLCAHARATLAVTGRQPEPAVLKFAHEYGATVLPLVPALAALLLKLARRGRALPPLRLLTNTGAELTTGTAAQLRTAFPGAAVVRMYGMTECKRITIAEPDIDFDSPRSVGTALTGTQVDIVGEDGEILPSGRCGQIVVRGPHLMDGYWRAPLATAERYRPHPVTGERALFTGDFGSLDEAGRLTFVGRVDDIFKRRGMRTSTAEIEAAALDVPGVTQAAVRPPGPDGELHLWVATEHSAEDVLRFLLERLEAGKVPDHCWVLDRLPQTAHGKVDKKRLWESLKSSSTTK
ncbi:class I adenylate-forming enzyme family protein [Streptomyces canus]|uniref:class I adenylate-forming enzyme family protein n=1 Tax=Streptomyces canus TaxID=58343 RepID=UPI0036A682CA